MGGHKHIGSTSYPIIPQLNLPTGFWGWSEEDAEISITLVFPQDMKTDIVPETSQFSIRYNHNTYSPVYECYWTDEKTLIILHHPTPNPSGHKVYIDYVNSPLPLTTLTEKEYKNFTLRCPLH
jgi:hypothetical protein